MVEPRYRIGAAARLSGLTTHTIRVWERRYGVLKPDRSQGGARLYTEQELEQLRTLKRAVDRGHARQSYRHFVNQDRHEQRGAKAQQRRQMGFHPGEGQQSQ